MVNSKREGRSVKTATCGGHVVDSGRDVNRTKISCRYLLPYKRVCFAFMFCVGFFFEENLLLCMPTMLETGFVYEKLSYFFGREM